MPLPTPSPSQLSALQALKAVADAGVSGATQKQAAIQSALEKQQDVEDFQKEYFDVVNDDILRRYEKERKWIDGQDVQNPILEADVQAFAAGDNSGRLWNGGDYAPTRIAQFDGTPLYAAEAGYELSWFPKQDTNLDRLQNGLAGQILLDPTAVLSAPMAPNATTLGITGNAAPIATNDLLFVYGGGFAAVVKVLSSVVGGSCAGETPPGSGVDEATCLANGGVWTPSNSLNIEVVIPPSGTIPVASPVGQKQFLGFTNAERTAQTSSVEPEFQDLMDTLIDELTTLLNGRKTALQAQLVEINANEDANLAASAATNVQDSIDAIDGFLSPIDISNTGIAAINTEKGVRQPQANQRITDIASAIAFGQDGTSSYYDIRFNTAEGRCRLNNGSIVLVNDLEEAKAGVIAGGAEATALSARYAALIP